MAQPQPHNGSTIETRNDALEALKRAWAPFVAECRSVLGSELHYQALLYHCLRAYGQVPSRQLGMNVKIRITEVVSDLFRELDVRKAEGFRGGFEPIPDVVIFGLQALRIEALHREGSDMLPTVVTVDTAPEANERMTSYSRYEVEIAAHEQGVCLFYVSLSDESIILPDVT